MSEEKKRAEGEISRRKFIKDAGLIVGGATLGSAALVTGAPAVTVSAQTPVALEVMDPSGAFEVTQLFAKRLDTLDGKKIGMIEGSPEWEGPRTHPLIASLLQKQYPTVKIVSYLDMPRTNTNDPESVAKVVKDMGLDAVIVGNAG